MDFPTALRFVLQREGKYTNNPADPGGATNYGITQKTYDAYRRATGLPIRDVRDIEIGPPAAEVETIYRKYYWEAAGCDQLEGLLALIHFDTAVNMGVSAAQHILNDADIHGLDHNVSAVRYIAKRLTRYAAIVDARPASQTFLGGWLHRMGELLRLA